MYRGYYYLQDCDFMRKFTLLFSFLRAQSLYLISEKVQISSSSSWTTAAMRRQEAAVQVEVRPYQSLSYSLSVEHLVECIAISRIRNNAYEAARTARCSYNPNPTASPPTPTGAAVSAASPRGLSTSGVSALESLWRRYVHLASEASSLPQVGLSILRHKHMLQVTR
jgi:hypothetical protein